MINRFLFPTDTIHFGKHKGKKIGDVITLDKPYFDWMLKGNFEINPILIDLSNGVDIVQQEIRFSFNREKGILTIRQFKFYKSKHIHGVRKSKQAIVSNQPIGQYKCDLPFTTELKEWVEYIDCTKFHNDSIEVKKSETIYYYNEADLTAWIESKLLIHRI